MSVKVATVNGTASAPNDYVAVPTTVVTFAAGETLKVVNVPVKGDATVEPSEKLTLKLSGPVGVVLADTVGDALIANDD